MTAREIRVAKLDKTRPVVILTREPARAAMTKVTVAPITTTTGGQRHRARQIQRNRR